MKSITLFIHIPILLITVLCSDPLPITNPWDEDYTGDYRFGISSENIPDTLALLAHYNVPVGFGRDTFININTDSIFWKKIDTTNYYKNRDNFLTIIPLSTDSLRSFILRATTPNNRRWSHRDTAAIINPFSVQTSIDSINKIIICHVGIKERYKVLYSDKYTVKWNYSNNQLIKPLFDSLIIHIKSNTTYSIGAVVTDEFGNTSYSMLTDITIGDFSIPKITKHPKSISITEGDPLVFNVKAIGLNVKYQWQKNKQIISNAIDSTLSIQRAIKADSGSLFRCIAYSVFGADTSVEALLAVSGKVIKPSISRQLGNVVCVEGDTVGFSMQATGTNLIYQWYKNGLEISGANQSTLKIPSAKREDNNSKYSCKVKNSIGEVQSNEAVLTVHYVPAIINQPQNISVQEGTSAQFSVEVIKGNPEETSFQWLVDGKDIVNATERSYTITAALVDSGKKINCIVTNAVGKVTSKVAILTVVKDIIKPKITKQPDNLTVNEYKAAIFSITAEGTNLIYQWLKNGKEIAGADQNTFRIYSVNRVDNYSKYSCTVKNSAGEVQSNKAMLTIIPSLSVVYHGNGNTGGDKPPKVTVDSGSQVTIANNGSLFKTGYTFVGWNTDSTGNGIDYQMKSYLTVDQNIDLYAKWAKRKITVTFSGNKTKASSVKGITTFDYGSKIDSLDYIINCESYTFDGWFRDSLCTIKWLYRDDSLISDITLYAKWIIKDVDGNVYTEVKIGNQIWLVENLKTTKYNDSSQIPYVPSNLKWSDLTSGGYCWYDNESLNNKLVFGALYNWHAVNSGKLAPKGWHVSSKNDLETIITYLGGSSIAGGKLKEPGAKHWKLPNPTIDNSLTDFNGLPGGSRSGDGSFISLYKFGTWWTSTDGVPNTAFCYSFSFSNTEVFIEGQYVKEGYSVRCVRDW